MRSKMEPRVIFFSAKYINTTPQSITVLGVQSGGVFRQPWGPSCTNSTTPSTWATRTKASWAGDSTIYTKCSLVLTLPAKNRILVTTWPKFYRTRSNLRKSWSLRVWWRGCRRKTRGRSLLLSGNTKRRPTIRSWREVAPFCYATTGNVRDGVGVSSIFSSMLWFLDGSTKAPPDNAPCYPSTASTNW